MKTPPELFLGSISASLLRQGDTFPCPRKGHPPFTHERADPIIALHRDKIILRIIPLSTVLTVSAKVFRGNEGRKPWALTPTQIKTLARWATTGSRRKASVVDPGKPSPKSFQIPPSAVKVPEGREGGHLRRRASTLPKAARGLVDDCDYLHKLSPAERAWKDQFDRETVLNRWYDKNGVEAFYPRGSEARRKLQFEYNRRVDDITGDKDSFPTPLDEPIKMRGRVWYKEKHLNSFADILPSNAPSEDALIDAIDRSRE